MAFAESCEPTRETTHIFVEVRSRALLFGQPAAQPRGKLQQLQLRLHAHQLLLGWLGRHLAAPQGSALLRVHQLLREPLLALAVLG